MRLLLPALSLLIGCPQPKEKNPPAPIDCTEGWIADGETCVPEACGVGTWGGLPVDDATIYVDASATEGGDGSAEAPLRGIQGALDLAGSQGGGLVAVAAGTYAETLTLGTDHADVHLAGRCRELVTIDASVGDADTPGILIASNSEEHEVSGLRVVGSLDSGIQVAAGIARLVDLSVEDSAFLGILAMRASSPLTILSIEGCELSGNGTVGLIALETGTEVTVVDTIVRDNVPGSSGGGYGIFVYDGAKLSGEGCELSGNADLGLAANDAGTSVVLVDSTIRDTLPDSTGRFGYAIGMADGAALSLEGCELVGNTSIAASAEGPGTELTIMDTTIRDTLHNGVGDGGYGIDVSEGASLSASGCELTGNASAGVVARDEDTIATLVDTTIRDTLTDARGEGGDGIAAQEGSTLSAASCELSGNSTMGVLAMDAGTRVELSDTIVRGTLPDVNDNGGYGIEVHNGATLDAIGCELAGNTGLGIAAHGAGTSLTLEATTIRDTLQEASGEGGIGLAIQEGASLAAKTCELSNNAEAGLQASGTGTLVRLQDTWVTDTRPTERGTDGYGVGIKNGATGTIIDCALVSNTAAGLTAEGAGTLVEVVDTIVQDTRPEWSGDFGHGIVVGDGARLSAVGCEVVGSRSQGIGISGTGTEAELTDTIVRDTLPNDRGELGYGVQVHAGASLTADGCVVAGNTAYGMLAYDPATTAALTNTTVRDTRTNMDGEAGGGIEVYGGAALSAKDCRVENNASVGVLVVHSGSHAVLMDTAIRGTRSNDLGMNGYGIDVHYGATLSVVDGTLQDNASAGILADGEGTRLTLQDTLIAGTLTAPGARGAVAPGLTAQRGSSVSGSGLLVQGNEGPGLWAWGEGARVHCSDCALLDNRFAGASVVDDGVLELRSSTISGTIEGGDLGGGVGIHAAQQLDAEPPTLVVEDSAITDNPVAGVWLSGEGSYLLTDNTIADSTGISHGSASRCGDGVYAAGSTAWQGSSGLRMSGNTITGNAGAGLFLDDAAATLGGNAWSGNDPDLLVQGAACLSPRDDYAEAPDSEICPAWDQPTCELFLRLDLDVADIETGMAPLPVEQPSAPLHRTGEVRLPFLDWGR